MKFEIGISGSKPVKVDAMVLSDTRALINASSGLGKSWLLRLIAENVASSIQTVIIDPEGEFSTLREKLDLLIVGEHGDLRADIQSAGLLARKLAETGVSAVIDIYDLPGKEDPWVKRRMFVALFLSELMNLPKKLYHPMLVKLDEAHQFAQEEITSDTYILDGKKVNPSMMSRSAVRSMMSAGRKRGIGGILATQRISKIDKDAIADARNVFIGGTTLDVDQRRAGDILGMSKSESVTLRDLDPGVFFAFGPAIDGKGIIQFTSAQVKTTHPKAGQKSSTVVPKASTQIAGIVEQFGDLPAEAAEEQETMQSLRSELTRLQQELRRRPVETKVEPRIERIEVPILPIEEFRSILASLQDLKAYAEDLKRIGEYIESYPLSLQGMLDTLKQAVDRYAVQPSDHLRLFAALKAKPVLDSKPIGLVRDQTNKDRPRQHPVRAAVKQNNQQDIVLSGPMQRILDAINRLNVIGIATPKQVAVAFLAGYSYGGGAFNNPRGALRSMGLVEYVGDAIRMTEEGRKYAFPQASALTTEELQNEVLSILPGPHQKILSVLISKYPTPISKDECASLAGYAPGGAFNNPLGRLRSMGLVSYPQPGYVVAESLLFLE